MIGPSTVSKVMMMVGKEVCVDTVQLHNFWEGVIKRLQWAPTAMQKMAATSVNVAAGWHAGKAADIVIVESDSALLEPREVWRMDCIRAVRFHCGPIERVQKDKNDFHGGAILRESISKLMKRAILYPIEQSFA